MELDEKPNRHAIEMVLAHSLSSATDAGAIMLAPASVDRSFWWA
jgi:hypothetical protein